MLVRLILVLTIVPLVELFILFRIAAWLEPGPTVGLVLLTGVVGAYLARREGIKAISRVQSDLSKGVMPTGALVNGLLVLAAGLLLVTPGILTDLVGFGLLIAPIRDAARRLLVKSFKRRIIRMGGEEREPFVDVVATSARNVEPADGTSPSVKSVEHRGEID